jgi:putative flippase GtrA
MQDGLRLGKRVLSARVVKFVLVGGSCGLIQLAILHTLVTSGLEEHLSNLIAFIISMEVNFTLSQLFTWRDRWSASLGAGTLLRRLIFFNAAATTTGVVNQGVFALLNLFIEYLPAAAGGIAVAAFTNFALNDRLVFRRAGSYRTGVGEGA